MQFPHSFPQVPLPYSDLDYFMFKVLSTIESFTPCKNMEVKLTRFIAALDLSDPIITIISIIIFHPVI